MAYKLVRNTANLYLDSLGRFKVERAKLDAKWYIKCDNHLLTGIGFVTLNAAKTWLRLNRRTYKNLGISNSTKNS